MARDEATGEWKFLNERERTIEQAIQEMVRPGGPQEHQPGRRAPDPLSSCARKI